MINRPVESRKIIAREASENFSGSVEQYYSFKSTRFVEVIKSFREVGQVSGQDDQLLGGRALQEEGVLDQHLLYLPEDRQMVPVLL